MGIDFTGKWRPLPNSLTIKESDIDGLGLFAKEDIPANTELGVMRVWLVDEWIRTALGSFSNHSETPTCENIEREHANGYKYYCLKTIKDLKVGDELTLKYQMPEYHD